MADEDVLTRIVDLARKAVDLQGLLAREEVEDARILGITPHLSLPATPGSSADTALAALAEVLEDLVEGRRRLRQRLHELTSRAPKTADNLVDRIRSLIDHLPDEAGDRMERLEHQSRQRQDTIAKLVEKAYDQGQTIARLRTALARLVTGDLPDYARLDAPGSDLPGYEEPGEDEVLVIAEDRRRH